MCADSREELGLEAGDLMQSLETGAILPEAVYELGQVIAGQVPGRRGPEDITLFASQGLALEDMAAARVVYDRASSATWAGILRFRTRPVWAVREPPLQGPSSQVRL